MGASIMTVETVELVSISEVVRIAIVPGTTTENFANLSSDTVTRASTTVKMTVFVDLTMPGKPNVIVLDNGKAKSVINHLNASEPVVTVKKKLSMNARK